MNGALPPALLVAALGLALSFADRRAMLGGGLAFLVLALGATFAHPDTDWREAILLATWASVIAISATVHWPRRLPIEVWVLLSVNAGLWCGLLVALGGSPSVLLKVVPWVLLCLPGTWLVKTGKGVAIKVVSSWLIAIAVLAAALSTVPLPGYMPDHME